MSLRKTLIAGSLAAAGGLALLAGGASAATLPVPAIPAIAQPGVDGGHVEQVQYRRDQRRWDRHRHGSRYRHHRPGWGHYHGGYWYRTPWWTLPLVVPPVIAPGPVYGGGHVAWCRSQYRSYDVRSNTYMGYDGYRHRCVSPY
ncbi:MAG: BA14K family protein [Parvibaculaceae bacterium]